MLDCLSAGIFVADHICSPISHMPRAGELLLADELPLAIGGCASNVAMNLARLGHRVGVAGCVGHDSFGRFIAETLQSAGVETKALREAPGVGTSCTLIINVRGEDRRFIHTIGANAAFRVSDVSLDEAASAKVFYVGGYLLMPNFDPQPLAELFGQLRRRGVKTVLDVVLPGPGDHWSRLVDVLPETDVFLPNSDESAEITGLDDPTEQARRLHDAGAKAVCITCGGQGTVLFTESVKITAGVYPVQFVGGTGAGDAFDAGYIAGLLADQSPLDCLRWGSALGASCVRSISATASVFNRSELLEFLANHELAFQNLA
jgi:sugar/nucleoside kinase (ribokinase family)